MNFKLVKYFIANSSRLFDNLILMMTRVKYVFISMLSLNSLFINFNHFILILEILLSIPHFKITQVAFSERLFYKFPIYLIYPSLFHPNSPKPSIFTSSSLFFCTPTVQVRNEWEGRKITIIHLISSPFSNLTFILGVLSLLCCYIY